MRPGSEDSVRRGILGGNGRVRLLVSGQTPEIRSADGRVTFEVPTILDHEVAVIEER